MRKLRKKVAKKSNVNLYFLNFEKTNKAVLC